MFSSEERRPVYGFSLVLLVWTDKNLRMPLRMRLWNNGGGPSKCRLPLELLNFARNYRSCRPADVRLDAWYASKVVLKRIRDYGWYFWCHPWKNRRFKGHAVHPQRCHSYRAETN